MSARKTLDMFESSKYSDEPYLIRFIEKNGSSIGKVKDDRGIRLVWHVARFGSAVPKAKIVEVLGTRTCEIQDGYGRSLAHELARNGIYDSTKVQMKMIDELGERIADTVDNNRYSVAHRLANCGSSEVHYRLIETFGARLSDIKDCYGRSVADEIISHSTDSVKARLNSVIANSLSSSNNVNGPAEMRKALRK